MTLSVSARCFRVGCGSSRGSFGLVLACLAMVLPASAWGRPFRPSMIPNGSKFSCANCHVSPSGGGTRTPFGQAVFAAIGGSSQQVPFWTEALAALDSDGDGFSNGVELGDPDGDFQNLGPSAQVTNPGLATSKPANRPPVLVAVPPQTVQAGSELTFAVQATDPDVPVQTLTFSLGAGAPEGATLGALTGVFQWTPAADTPAGLVTVPIVVTDSGVPPQSATGTVDVTITRPPLAQPTIGEPGLVAGLMSCSVSTVSGGTYFLEFREDLGAGDWSTVSQVLGDGTNRSLQDPNPAGARGFYRIRVE